MTGWLYQMTADKRTDDNWPHEEYEATVCEGKDTPYEVRKLLPKGGKIQPGDIIVLFYAPGSTNDPKCGICGWGVVLRLEYEEKKEFIRFRPIRPSDYLKTKPIWDDTVKGIMREIREPVFMGTMWEIKTDPLTRLIRMIEPL